MDIKKTASIGVLTAMAIVLSVFENMIPAPVPVAGVKLGLANVVVIICLYYLDTKSAFFVSILRVIIVGTLFGGLSSIIYALSGSVCSFIAMMFLKSTNKFSIVGVSVFGACFHVTAQLIVATLVVENIKILYYLPILLVTSVCSGIIVGLVAYYTLYNLNFVNS